jgi:hypothetical protein
VLGKEDVGDDDCLGKRRQRRHCAFVVIVELVSGVLVPEQLQRTVLLVSRSS